MTARHRERLCAHCGAPVRRKSLNGPVPTYCKRSCRQRAFEERQAERRVAAAERAWLTAAGGTLGTPSRDDSDPGSAPDPSRDGSSGGAARPGRPVVEVMPLFPVEDDG
jgi:endogenous inhibitor of DNA gyrase (YacG/DUF329 family)